MLILLDRMVNLFSDVELIKKCIVEVVQALYTQKVGKYENISLSRRTIVRRQEEIVEDFRSQLFDIIHEIMIIFFHSRWMNHVMQQILLNCWLLYV